MDKTNLLIDAIQDKRKYFKQKDLTDSQFFIYLSEFVSFVQSLPIFRMIESEMESQKRNDIKESVRLEKLVLRDIERVRETLLGKLKKEKIPLIHLNDPSFKQYYSPGTNENQRYEDLKSGKHGISGDKTIRLYNSVRSMLWGLYETGHREIIAPYVTFSKYGPGYTSDYPEDKEYISSYRISTNFDEYSDSLELLKIRDGIVSWSVYEQLLLVPFALYGYRQELNRRLKLYKAHKLSMLSLMDIQSWVSEMKGIVNGTEKSPYLFKRDKYLSLIEMFIFFIIDQLRSSAQQTDKVRIMPPLANPSTLQSMNRLSLPSGVKWCQVKLSFINKERAKIIVRNQVYEVTPEQMDMSDKRMKNISKPTVSWEFLYLLAQNGGVINTDEKVASTTKGERYRKAKQELTDKLCKSIGISDDPFYPVEPKREYKLRMTIFVSKDNSISSNSQPDLPKGEADENSILFGELTSTS
ncbi:MAG: hypothetical protein WCJ70_04600 [bacterium]